MAESEPFTFVTESEEGQPKMIGDYQDFTSGRVADLEVQMVAALRKKHPELIVTTIPALNVNLIFFAEVGFAEATLDTETDSIVRWRGFVPPPPRGGTGRIGQVIFFAKYHYKWAGEDFILYTVKNGPSMVQFVLKEPQGNETTMSPSQVTDKLILAAGEAFLPKGKNIYVYDLYWSISKDLWEQVDKTTWDQVILDPDMKKDLTTVTSKFFDSKEIYKEYGVPWKRGLIFHGPVGNGKTISIKALMHALGERDDNIPCLYVKSAPNTWNISDIFSFAREMSPCFLVLEDIETIVTSDTRSYFFNEVDGLANNDGIFMVATTNYLDRLDPGLSKRPSRFDRKYLFPLPSLSERTEYCEYWRRKLKGKDVEFPKKLCHAIASITDEFSFAYLQEAFVATLLELAHHSVDMATGLRPASSNGDDDDDDDDLDRYQLWRVMKRTVALLRKDMDSSRSPAPSAGGPPTDGPRAPESLPGDILRDTREASARVDQMHMSKADARPPFDSPLPDLASLTFRQEAVLGRQQSSALERWRLARRGGDDGLTQASAANMYPNYKYPSVNPRAFRYTS